MSNNSHTKIDLECMKDVFWWCANAQKLTNQDYLHGSPGYKKLKWHMPIWNFTIVLQRDIKIDQPTYMFGQKLKTPFWYDHLIFDHEQSQVEMRRLKWNQILYTYEPTHWWYPHYFTGTKFLEIEVLRGSPDCDIWQQIVTWYQLTYG